MNRLPILPRTSRRPARKTISIPKGAQLTLRGKAGTKYDVYGWLEVEQAKSGPQLVVVNITAYRRPDPKRKRVRAPYKIHITHGGPFKGKLDFETLRGAVRFPILAAWDELEPSRDEVPFRSPPRSMTGTLALTLAPGRDGLRLRGAGSLDWLPPFQRDKTPFDFTFSCKVEGAKCGEVQLCIDVAMTGNPRTPVISDAQVTAAIAELNRIWGCPGQCCIRFTAAEAAPQHNAPDQINARDGNALDEARLRDRFRDLSRRHTPRRRCWPVIFTGQILTGLGPAGVGKFDALGSTISHGAEVTRGSVVSTNAGQPGGAYTPVSIGGILAHEMGHALGVATAPGAPDADGEIHHSSNPGNLMREAGDPRQADAVLQGKTKLNAKQCARARNSPVVRQTDADCGNEPLEVI